MLIQVNGESTTTADTTLSALIGSLGLDMRYAAIERNGAIVPRNRWDETALAEGDKLELLTFIGGG